MNPKQNICVGNVNLVNLDQYRINWQPVCRRIIPPSVYTQSAPE